MQESKSDRLVQAEAIIKRHVLFSTGAGFIPIPVFDIVAVTAIQLDMLRQLCKLYDQDFNDSKGKAFIGAISGTTLSRIAAHSVGSIFKVVPVIGSALGGVTVAVFAGSTTYAIGQVVAEHFESGGSITNFDKENLKDFYEEQLKKGKEIVKEWKEEANEAEETDDTTKESQTPLEEKLNKLEALKAAGLVTETEYKRIKARILKHM